MPKRVSIEDNYRVIDKVSKQLENDLSLVYVFDEISGLASLNPRFGNDAEQRNLDAKQRNSVRERVESFVLKARQAIPLQEYLRQEQPNAKHIYVIGAISKNIFGELVGRNGLVCRFEESAQQRLFDAAQLKRPFQWPTSLHTGNKVIQRGYFFGDHFWQISDQEKLLDEEDLILVFLETVDAERRKFERLRTKFLKAEAIGDGRRREPIPEEVRIFVWRRDEGKCVKCGSNQNLEYDHIIPLSKGGSNSARNIQLLCERCNREKSDQI